MAAAGAAKPAQAGATTYDLSVFLGPPVQAPVAEPAMADAPVLIPPPRVASDSEPPVDGGDFGTGFRVVETPPETAENPKQTAEKTRPDTSSSGSSGGIVSELRLGVGAHDLGPFTTNTQREDGTWNLNAEVLFQSPDFLDFLWSPRPHLGGHVNTAGETSQVYAGLSWEWYLAEGWFAGFAGGGAWHNGETTGAPAGRKNLGCSVLFRGALETGYRFAGRHGISLMLDHISNAELCDANEGLETVTVRYGYRF